MGEGSLWSALIPGLSLWAGGSLTGASSPPASLPVSEGGETKPLSGIDSWALPVRFFFPVVLCCSTWRPWLDQNSGHHG